MDSASIGITQRVKGWSLRDNGLGASGWDAVMDAVAAAGKLESLNGVDGLEGLASGGCASVDLSSRELGQRELAVGVARLLPRSAATVSILILRWALAAA